jgi:hypothetical protein
VASFSAFRCCIHLAGLSSTLCYCCLHMSMIDMMHPVHTQPHEDFIWRGAPDALQKVAVLPAPGGRVRRKRRLGPSIVMAVLASPSGRRMVSVTFTCTAATEPSANEIPVRLWEGPAAHLINRARQQHHGFMVHQRRYSWAVALLHGFKPGVQPR